jgi:branched-chain amino acid transport system substrate-binding protein
MHQATKRPGRPRHWLLLALIAVLTLLLAACAPSEELSGEEGDSDAEAGEEAPEEDEAADGEAVKIGVVAPATGALAAAAADMRNGWDLYWELNDNQAAGVEVETIHEDDTGDPYTGRTKAERLVEGEGVSMVVGPIHANIGYAIADYVSGQGLPSIMSVAAADDLTQRDANPLVVRTGAFTSSQMNFAAGQWAYDQGHRTAVTLCPDYAYGHESCGGFVETFTEAGGEILGQLWNPLNTQDFSTYFNQMRDLNPDILFLAGTGADAPRIINGYTDFGLAGEIPMIGNATLLEQSVLRGGNLPAEGMQSFSYFTEGRDSPGTADFVAAYEEAYGEVPSLYSAGAYVTAEWIALTMENVDGDVSDSEAFVEAMHDVTLDDSPFGPLELDEYGQIVGSTYLREVTARDDGSLWNTVVDEIPDTSQFWTFEPDEFLEQPVYSREFQGN